MDVEFLLFTLVCLLSIDEGIVDCVSSCHGRLIRSMAYLGASLSVCWTLLSLRKLSFNTCAGKVGSPT
jgi:hypothetical protein